jgi:hypothetical protein
MMIGVIDGHILQRFGEAKSERLYWIENVRVYVGSLWIFVGMAYIILHVNFLPMFINN